MKSAKGWSVFWRASKSRWVLSRAVAGGRWEQKILTDAPHENTKAAEKEALRVAQAWMARQGERPGEALDGAPRGMTLADAAAKWLALAELRVKGRLIAPATLKDYRIDSKLYVLPPLAGPAEVGDWPGGTLPLSELDVPLARRWLRLIRDTRSASTVRGARSSFATLFDCALAEGWVKGDNPLASGALLAELPPLPVAKDPVVLALRWVQALLDDAATPLAWRARYALAATSGARDGEIHGARICDLTLKPEPTDDGVEPIPSWRIEQATAIVGREGFATENATKTRSSVRTLPLHPAAVAAIGEWLSEGWARWVGRSPTLTDPLFPGEDGLPSRPRSAENLRDDLARLGLPTSVDGRAVDFKAFRATFATTLEDAGVDEHVRKRLLGHASRSVTERHYTRRELARLSAAVRAIPLAWSATRSQVVSSVTGAGESTMRSAIPGRVELPTNGLGNPCDIPTGCDRGRDPAGGRGRQLGVLSGCDNGSTGETVALGHKARGTAVTELASLAVASRLLVLADPDIAANDGATWEQAGGGRS